MRERTRNYLVKRRGSPVLWIGLIGILVLTAVGMWNFYASNKVVTENVSSIGYRIVGTARSEEEAKIKEYRALLDAGCFGVIKRLEDGQSYEQIFEYLKDYREYIDREVGSEYDGIYGYIGGRLDTGGEWTAGEDFDIDSRDWYVEAVKAGGKTICTEAYTDLTSGKQVITLAKCIDGTNVMAVDIVVETIQQFAEEAAIFSESSQMIYSGHGTVMAGVYNEKGGDGYSTGKEEADDILKAIHREGGTKGRFHYTNDIGQTMEVFYRMNSLGWVNTLVVPEQVIHIEGNKMLFWEAFILIAFIIIMIGGLVFTNRQSKRVNQTSDVLTALGDMYYAIYLVDIEADECKIIKYPKGSFDVGLKDGEYTEVHSKIATCIDEDNRQKFKEIMSLSHMRQMVREGVRKEVMECQRLFEPGYRWVSIELQTFIRRGRQEAVLAFQEIHAAKVEEIERGRVLKDALKAARSANSAKSDFLSKMSHDIRTPMNAIVGFTEIAQRNPDDKEKVQDALGKIKSSSQYLLRIINNILDMSKIEQNKTVLHEENFNLREELEKTVNLFEDEADKKRLDLRVTILPMKIEWVAGDMVRLRQICYNILSNAVKFTPEGGTVGFHAKAQPGPHGKYVYCTIEISDTGIGIPEKFLKQIFEPFERADDSKTDVVEGTGLGMPIVKGLAELMGGTVRIESEERKGTTVLVKIPFKICKESEGKHNDWEGGAELQGDGCFRGKKILLAEDNALNREILSELLEEIGVEVDTTENGSEAVKHFKEAPESYDMIFLDIQMPVMNGYEAAKAVRSMDIDRAKTIPIAAMTANAFDEDVRASYEAGMNEHLAKPVDMEQIKAVLRRYFS